MRLRLLFGFFVAATLAGSPLMFASADTDVPPPPSAAPAKPDAADVPDGYGFTWSTPPTAAEAGALALPAAKPAAAAPVPAVTTAAMPAATPPATVETKTGAGAARAAPATPDQTKPADKAAVTVPAATAVKSGILSSDSGDYQYEAVPDGAAAAAPEAVLPEAMVPDGGAFHRPMIAIVIDDMGVDRKHSARALKLPAAVTMSYLPYSTEIREQTAAAKKAGHELMVHMPMQPDNKTLDPGPNYLGIDMSPLELHDRVIKNLDAFTGYHEVNNHMGSKFTGNREGLEVVMAVLAERHLMFLDSRTAPDSIAEKVAREHHLQTTHRDIFIDDDDKHAAVVAAQLARTEKVAKRTGAAIAIGHPKDITLDALEKWLPTLKAKGFDVVALSTVITRRDPKTAVPVAAGRAQDKTQYKTPAGPAEKKPEAAAAPAKTEPVAATDKPGDAPKGSGL